MIRLGAWSSVLLVLAVQALLLALLLALSRGNRRANLALAMLLVVVAGLLTPFILGYAGAYDAYPWLTFAPFAVPLAVPPLAYAHVVALSQDRRLGWPHWVAPGLQFGWQAAAFFLPLEAKPAFDARWVEPLIGPLSNAAVLLSMAGYGWLSWRALRNYEAWLAERRRQPRPARRIRAMLLLLLPLIAARAGYALFEQFVREVTYFDLFGYYLLLGTVAILIGLDGWRQAAEPTPAAVDEDAEWTARGAEWIARLHEAGWWRDSDLTLDALARKLGTNGNHLTRALGRHGGFAAVLGALRAEAVAKALAAGDGRDLLTLAFDCGFGSKASFNRAFRARFGMAPSAWRRDGASPPAGAMLAD